MAAEVGTTKCAHCLAGAPSVWDDVLFHYAHPHPDAAKLLFCHDPWRARCRRCSATPAAPGVEFCAWHETEEVAQ